MKCPKCGFDIAPRRAQRQSNMLHKLIAAYAHAQGENPEECKVWLKYWFGPWLPYPFEGEPPPWPGRFVEMYHGTPEWCIVYLKSESVYTKAEETRLIDGAMQRCIEVAADLSWMEEL